MSSPERRWVGVRIEGDLMDLLGELAKAEDLSQQAYVNRALRAHLGQRAVPALRYVATGQLVIALRRLADALAEPDQEDLGGSWESWGASSPDLEPDRLATVRAAWPDLPAEARIVDLIRHEDDTTSRIPWTDAMAVPVDQVPDQGWWVRMTSADGTEALITPLRGTRS